MYEKPTQGSGAENLGKMSREEVEARLLVLKKRLLVVEELSNKPGLAEGTILEERNKLDSEKALLEARLQDIESMEGDAFSGAVDANGGARLNKRIDAWKDGRRMQ